MAQIRPPTSSPRGRSTGPQDVIDADYTNTHHSPSRRVATPERDNVTNFSASFNRAADRAVRTVDDDEEGEDIAEQSIPREAQRETSLSVPPPSAPMIKPGSYESLAATLGVPLSAHDIINQSIGGMATTKMIAGEVAIHQGYTVAETLAEQRKINKAVYKDQTFGVIGNFFANLETGWDANAELRDIRRTQRAMGRALSDSMVQIAAHAGNVAVSSMTNDVELQRVRGQEISRLELRRLEGLIETDIHDNRSRIDYEFGPVRQQADGKTLVIEAQNKGELTLVLADHLEEFSINFAKLESRSEEVAANVLHDARRLNLDLIKLKKDMRVRGLSGNDLVYEAIAKGLAEQIIDSSLEMKRELTRILNAPKVRTRRVVDEPEFTLLEDE